MTDLQGNQRSLSPELQEEVSGIAMSLMAAVVIGLPIDQARAELDGRYKEILKRKDLSPWEIAYLRGKVERWPPGYAEEWARGYTEGLAKSEAKGILSVLEVRGIPVPDGVRERITTCTDLDTLTLWFDRSLTATAAEDLFAERSPGGS
ncbi:hypothetical protein ACIHFB_35545 [Streptomyces sp. NPDC051963]|uniref:hypothetical protein n=1 Tax=Streptomyces sp. NPDC051963 TaxID=3365678 RepID=UPI0037D0CC18